MSLENAVAALERLASDEDPIRYRGADTTPRDLADLLNPQLPASSVRIGYYSEHGYVRNGTVSGMVKDRERLMKKEGPQW